MQFCMVCVSCIDVSSLADGRMCSNRYKLNYSISMKSVHFVGLRYVIVSQCTAQKTQNVAFKATLVYDTKSRIHRIYS